MKCCCPSKDGHPCTDSQRQAFRQICPRRVRHPPLPSQPSRFPGIFRYNPQKFSFSVSSVPGPTGPSVGHERRFSRDPRPAFSVGGHCEQFWHGQISLIFDVVHAEFPMPTTASPTLLGALKDSFGETVVACEMPEPCKFPSLDICQKRFLWTH